MRTQTTCYKKNTGGIALSALLVLTLVALPACDGPSAPQLGEMSNVYDPESDNYIPKADINTAPVTNIRTFEAESGGVFETNYGKPVTAKGVCWSNEENPTVENDCTNDGQGYDAFTSTMEGLDRDHTYYVRAYATNEAGTIYGEQRSFRTQDGRPIISIELERRTISSIRVKGEINSEVESAPIIRYAVCYDEAPNPDMSSECVSHDGEADSYSIEMDGLDVGTSYYFFAYAVNNIGTGSSEVIEITTQDGIPVLRTTRPFDIDNNSTSVRTGGEVIHNSGAEIIERGVCYIEGRSRPDFSGRCVEAGTGTGSFEVLLENLSPDQEYSVRSYATTEYGTGWGNQESFTLYTRIYEITNPNTGQIWMDRNLGASRAAGSLSDSLAYGDLYQWGRVADGHQKRNSLTTTTLSNSDQPGHSYFILAPNGNRDWRNPHNSDLWQGADGINNPCPAGYRLPTEAEWNAERETWWGDHEHGAIGSPLRLPATGGRSGADGEFWGAETAGFYWASNVSGNSARRLYFGGGRVNWDSFPRKTGLSVRCIKD